MPAPQIDFWDSLAGGGKLLPPFCPFCTAGFELEFFRFAAFVAADVPRIALNLPLLMESDIVGDHWGAWVPRAPEEFERAMEELGAWFRERRIRPYISRTYPLSQVSEAMHAMLERRVTGKVLIAIPTEGA